MQVKRFQGKVGEDYDLSRLAFDDLDETEKVLGEVIKEEFQNESLREIKVIEIGCGTGFTTSIILNSDNRTKVVAVDNESIMIDQTRENLKEFIENNRVELIKDDALESLKKQDSNSFDVFASGATIHNFTQDYRKKVVKEIYRVLKPEGIFVNADKYAIDDELEHKKSLDWDLQQIKKEYSKVNRPDLVKDWVSHYLEDDKPEIIMKESESIDLMRGFGFKNVKVIFRKQMAALMFARK